MDALYRARQGRAGGGPVINKGFIGGGAFADAIAQATAAGAFNQPSGTESAVRTSKCGPIQNQGQAMPFMGGSGVATPDPNISQAEAMNNLQNMSGGFWR